MSASPDPRLINVDVENVAAADDCVMHFVCVCERDALKGRIAVRRLARLLQYFVEDVLSRPKLRHCTPLVPPECYVQRTIATGLVEDAVNGVFSVVRTQICDAEVITTGK